MNDNNVVTDSAPQGLIQKHILTNTLLNLGFFFIFIIGAMVFYNLTTKEVAKLNDLEQQKLSILSLGQSVFSAETKLLQILIFDRDEIIPNLLAESENFYLSFSQYRDMAYKYDIAYDLSYAQESEPVIYKLRDDIVEALVLYRQGKKKAALDYYKTIGEFRLDILRNIIETSLYAKEQQITIEKRNQQRIKRTALIFFFVIVSVLILSMAWLNFRINRDSRIVNELINSRANERSLFQELEQKNEELMRFNYTVSHDLKSPLITMGGFLGYLEKDIKLGDREKIQTDLEQIKCANSTMQYLLEGLLELSRVGRLADKPVRVSLNETINTVRNNLAGILIDKNISFEISKELPDVMYDRLRLDEVFQNLIENAAKFMENKKNPTIQIGGHYTDGAFLCYVKDNGIGIENNYKTKIFGLFEVLDKQQGGIGIGLALVKRIVEHHGGQIWVESDGPGCGSTFFFTLPMP